jgi:ATP-dependent DNA helicase RecG
LKSLFTDRQKQLLENLNITNWFDLITHLPSRYEDRTTIVKINSADLGQNILILGKIIRTEITYRGKRNLNVFVQDEDENLIILRFINFYPNQLKQFVEGMNILAYGLVRKYLTNLEMIHPEVQVSENLIFTLPTNYTPIYPTTSGLGQKNLSKLIQKALAYTKEKKFLNFIDEFLNKDKKINFISALDYIHNPTKEFSLNEINQKITPYHERVKYAEVLAQQLYLKISKADRVSEKAFSYKDINSDFKSRILEKIPFVLTKSQKLVIEEIENNLNNSQPMYRILQGDVGSGKTIVAIIASVKILSKNHQVALMVPTEILAKQHYLKIKNIFDGSKIRASLLTGSIKGKEREDVLRKISSGETQFIIGTHALFQDSVDFKQLGLCIIDEQHRFGVKQRMDLMKRGKQEFMPHQLMMSATPIPRTLSMTYFADLEVSSISEMPKNRIPITTKLIRETRRDELIELLKLELHKGNQIYWVCPLVEESEKIKLVDAKNTFEGLKSTLPEFNVQLIHGRMKEIEKSEIMQNFLDGKINLLVATTVIEVGVDVPNATVMVIEHSERLGLSQLHQLRGRVGRGDKKSMCIFLYSDNLSINAKDRLRTIYENTDGFIIAENDLKIRGPGELIGTRQSGIPSLKIANLIDDEDIVHQVVKDSANMINSQYNDVIKYTDLWFGHKNFLRS